jgi:hypothetical protein
LQHSTRRQAAEYFSMVRRRLCCASLVSRSTSFSTSTLYPFLPFESMGRLRAISCRIKGVAAAVGRGDPGVRSVPHVWQVAVTVARQEMPDDFHAFQAQQILTIAPVKSRLTLRLSSL